MDFRSISKWLLVLLLFAAVGAVGAVWYVWQRGDELLRQTVLASCAERVPEWEVRIGRARSDLRRQIRLFDVEIRPRNQSTALLVLPEVVLAVDWEAYVQRQQVVLEGVRLLEPVLQLMRDEQGVWNVSQLPPLPKSGLKLSPVDIVSGEVRVSVQQAGRPAFRRRAVKHVDLKLSPKLPRAFAAQGTAHVDHVGPLSLQGRVDLDNRTWQIQGAATEMQLGTPLDELVTHTLPEVEHQLAQLTDRLRGGLGAGREPYRTASIGDEPAPSVPRGSAIPPPIPVDESGGLGLSGTCELRFLAAQQEPDTPPEFQVWGALKGGQLSNPALPWPLHELAGFVYCDNRRIRLWDVRAKNGIAGFALSVEIDRSQMLKPGQFTLTATNVALDLRLRNRLPPHLQKHFDNLRPTGTVNVECTFREDGRGGWERTAAVVTARECTIRPKKFPYPVHNLHGTIRQQNAELVLDFDGLAGRRPVKATGTIRGTGPAAETLIDVHASDVPLDETVLNACNDSTRRTLESLNLQGAGTGHLRLYRPPGYDQKTGWELTVTVKDAALEYEQFRYRVTQLSGQVQYSSEDRTWRFQKLHGKHDEAVLDGYGWFSTSQPPGELHLMISARGAHFDRQLRGALPLSVQEVWDQIRPAGRLDVLSQVDWVCGQSPNVALQHLSVHQASMHLQAFDYRLEGIDAQLKYSRERDPQSGSEKGVVRMESFSARHDETTVRTGGKVECLPTGGWTVRLEGFSAEKLRVDRELLRALPAGLREALEQLNPQGPLSVSGVVEMRRGTARPGDPVTAGWDLAVDLDGATLDAGAKFEQVRGRITTNGKWDGHLVNCGGRLDLDSLQVLGHEITQLRGPYTLRNRELTIGSRDALLPNPPQVEWEQRVSGRFVGGWITLDALAMLTSRPAYRAVATLSNGDLAEYSRRYLQGARNIRGVMNGAIDVNGRSATLSDLNGHGYLQISPAELYELPVIVQIFNALTLRADKTMFRYARLNFTVGNRQFDFKPIDLVGDGISLRGQGWVNFDGRLGLTFYSMLSRNQLPIPLVKPLLDQATKGWVGVQVGGTVRAPVAKYTAVPVLDEAMKEFLNAFETSQRQLPPRTRAMPPGVR